MPHVRNISSSWGSILLLAFTAPLLSVATGCGTGLRSELPLAASPKTAIVGSVHGGQQPVVGASIQLYAVGAPLAGGGYGKGAVPLISGTLPITDRNGFFTITGTYDTPIAASHFYIVATGGSPGFGAPSNPNIVLLSSVGSCTATVGLSPSLFVSINEVTTAASLLTLQPYTAPNSITTLRAPAIGAPSNDYVGLQNAVETVNNLVDVSTGTVINPTINWTANTSNGLLLNTFADIIAACVNSDPGTSNTCNTFYTQATAANAAYTAADTTQAALSMAQNPTHNVAPLFNLIAASGPFIGYSAAPGAFSVGIVTSNVACQSPVVLGSAANFEVMGGSTVTNTGATSISGGNLGLSPGTSVTGFPPGVLVPPGLMIVNNPVAAQAQGDLNIAYLATAGLVGGALLPADISGLTLPPGLYKTTGAELIGSTLTLDGHGDSNAQFIFQIATALTAAGSSQVILINGAQAKNIYWQIGTAATLGVNSISYGTFMAHTSITMNTTATLKGRALAQIGAVTMDTNAITAP